MRYIAFLRAINVGGHNVKMDELRRHFEALRFSNVETFIASGNVVFETSSASAKGLEKKIEGKLRTALGYEVTTFLRTESELAAVAKYAPFPQKQIDGAAALNVAFLADALNDDSRTKLMKFRTDIDDFHTYGREIYWLCRSRQSDSTFSNASLEKALGLRATFRGVNTVKKMAARYCSGK